VEREVEMGDNEGEDGTDDWLAVRETSTTTTCKAYVEVVLVSESDMSE